MSFVATPSLAFITGHQLTPETANYWRVAISQAIDGSGGGTYTPTVPIIIGGAQGLRIGSGGVLTILSGGTVSVPSGGTVSAAAGSTVTLTGTNTLNGTNTVSGTTTISGATTADNFTMSGTNKVKLASRSITRVQPFHFRTSDTTVWNINDAGNGIQLLDSAVTLLTPVRPPHGVVLTGATLYIQPAAHGALPATMPQFSVRSVSATGGQSILGTATDSSANVAAYNAAHTISISGLSHTVDRTTLRYFVRVVGEGGANFAANLIVAQVALTYTITEYDED